MSFSLLSQEKLQAWVVYRDCIVEEGYKGGSYVRIYIYINES